MTALLALITVVTLGVWIPMAQIVPGIPQSSRTFYVTAGNLIFAVLALLIGGGHLVLGWRPFWLPLGGGVLWTAGSFCAFRATETIGLARAAGTWTPLNIIVAFVWGALLFRELNTFTATHFALLAAALILILIGMLLIVGSQDNPVRKSHGMARPHAGWRWAGAAGILWGSYFVPAQWADIPGRIANVPLAIGIFVAGSALELSRRELTRCSVRVTTLQITAGVVFGIGDLALLGLISRVGTGVGFTLAQLSLLVNASVGIWVFKVPPPGSRAARTAQYGILIAGVGGCVIGAMR